MSAPLNSTDMFPTKTGFWICATGGGAAVYQGWGLLILLVEHAGRENEDC
jgi:hypothetical protein